MHVWYFSLFLKQECTVRYLNNKPRELISKSFIDCVKAIWCMFYNFLLFMLDQKLYINNIDINFSIFGITFIRYAVYYGSINNNIDINFSIFGITFGSQNRQIGKSNNSQVLNN